MKFTVSSNDFYKQLQIAAGAISPNPVLPVLEDFLFEAAGNNLMIASTNLETSIITNLTVDCEEEGVIAVPAKILLETLKALPDQPIQFHANKENKSIEITSAYGKYKLAGDATDDFPQIPEDTDTNTLEMSSQALSNAISKTLFATSNDELRLAMTGVFFHVDYNKIIFVATDAHKLVKYTVGDISSDVSQSFIVPKKGLSLVKNALGDDDNVKVSFNQKNVFFSFGDTMVVCRLVDAKYPDFNAVIPVDNNNILQLARTEFQNSLRRIAIYSNKTTNQVILNATEGSLTISAQDLDFSNEATEQLSCQYDGEPITIGFNAKFLIEMLGILDSSDIKIRLSTPNKAGILLPDEEKTNEDILMLVMPVMMSH